MLGHSWADPDGGIAMKGRSRLALVGFMVFLAGCNGGAKQPSATTPDNQAAGSPQVVAGQPTQKFNQPVVQQTANGPKQVVPGLLQQTNPRARIPAIAKGRPDPFAPLNSGPLIQTNVPTVKTALNVANPRSATNTWNPPVMPPIALTPPLPIPRSASRQGSTALPNSAPRSAGLPSASLPPNLAPIPTAENRYPVALPPIVVPIAPPSKTALADAIQITGVVQVRGKWQVIVKEPDAASSRYVAVGDRLAGGRVLIKRIINEKGIDPFIVLVQNGVEVTKPVGAAVGPLASL